MTGPGGEKGETMKEIIFTELPAGDMEQYTTESFELRDKRPRLF